MAEAQSQSAHMLTARDLGLVACTQCTRVWPGGTERCARCGAPLVSRDSSSLSRVWAWWTVGLICYIPANLYPMLKTTLLAKTSGDTIVGGAVALAMHGSFGVALVILIASVAIPVGKFAAVAYLALSVKHRWKTDHLKRTQLYEVVEFIGRWSMIDVFVVAVLSALVQLSVVVSINPGPAAINFALSVIFTMFSARSFDSRLIWDSLEPPTDDKVPPT
ncbi:paraquat-inducible protein A [Tropicimonas isoalkanivorans]|uniref:Paraquat-inducible protein A n=1 Tax=Tropicimonas isoalkanivorans TaxID=441112 RepID=A0A1I1P7I2_9RHOB|nr:paraquat-inducible protein A [Tropicimonas isoalkanivorans]SFD05769.1 paraquat-inducible protein A [Tropicimonas isoalkanivorans]